MSLKDEKRREMILKGNLFKTIIIICLPLAIYQLFNSFYTLIDQAICVHISTTAQNAVSSISQIKNTIAAFGAGLAAGGAVLVSRHYGFGNLKEARQISANVFFISNLTSILLILIMLPLAQQIMRLCQIAESSIAIGTNYFRLQLFELAIVSLNSVFIGLEKAKGNSKTILFLNVMVLLIKLLLTWTFVYKFKLNDIIYVEIATIIGQLFLLAYAICILFGKNNILRISIKMMVPKKKYLISILKLSIPIFLGKFVMNLGKVIVNGLCGFYWNEVTSDLIVGTLGISNSLCGIVNNTTGCFEDGESSIVSQNLGNQNIRRALKAFVTTLILSTIISVLGYILLRFVFIDWLVDKFAGSDDKSPLYKQMIKEIFVWDSLSIIALGINSAVLGLLYGFGQTSLSTILNLGRIGTRILLLVLLYNLNSDMSATLCVGLSMGISNTIILILSVSFLLIFLKKIRKHGYRGMHLNDPEPDVKALVYEE